MRLTIHFSHYWHAGTGRGSGHHLDAIVNTDADGLPFLPGKTLRGLLRDACQRLERWNSCPEIQEGDTERLFGSTAFVPDKEHPRPRESTVPGSLFVSDARLPEAVARWLSTEEGRGLLPGLFREMFSTAMTGDGVAKDKSLRGMQVVVPLSLTAEVSPLPGRTPPPDWERKVAALLPMIRSAGAHRSRGYGRCRLEVSR